MKELILVTDSNYVTFIILNIIFIAIATITIMLFINEKNKNINNKIQELEDKIDKKRKRPRGKIEKESNN
jgi:cell division protein FtsL